MNPIDKTTFIAQVSGKLLELLNQGHKPADALNLFSKWLVAESDQVGRDVITFMEDMEKQNATNK